MPERHFSPGFRLSALDVVVLVVGAAVAIAVSSVDVWIGAAIAFVVAHFFLFCNVLRMSRPLELVWAAAFAALSIAATAFDLLGWPLVFAWSICLTGVLAIIEARRPSYHGVGWRSLNPKLREWWNTPESV
jgi:hypothetical protein